MYKAVHRSDSQIHAIKKLKLSKEREGFPITAVRELASLQHTCPIHPNLVRMDEIVVGKQLDTVFIVMEYFEHDLRELSLSMKHPFQISELKTILKQLLGAVEAMHSRWMIHRDLKTSNLLLSNNGQLRVADFGLARKTSQIPPTDLTPMVVTIWYRAPELLLGKPDYDFAVDIWSVGCIFGELLLGEPLFQGKTELDQLDKIFSLLGAPNASNWPEFSSLPHASKINITNTAWKHRLPSFIKSLSANGLDLLSTMLCLDPSKRISARDALKHAFFVEEPTPKDPESFPSWPARSSA